MYHQQLRTMQLTVHAVDITYAVPIEIQAIITVPGGKLLIIRQSNYPRPPMNPGMIYHRNYIQAFYVSLAVDG